MKPPLVFLTPGPTQLHPEAITGLDEALKHHVCSISHRSEAFRQFYMHTEEKVREVLAVPDGYSLFFLSSSTEAMERIIQNCSSEHTFHIVNGHFSDRFRKIASELGRTAASVDLPFGEGGGLGDVAVPNESELVTLSHLETSAGSVFPIDDVRALRARHPDPLLFLDVTTSVPHEVLPWEDIDGAFFSVQKGFGLPSGLGVLLVNARALEKSAALKEAGHSIGSYHSFQSLWSHAQKHVTMETPNVLGIYLLGRVCSALLEYGISRIRTETHERAAMLYTFLDAHPQLKPFVIHPTYRAETVIAVNTPQGSAPIIEQIREETGIVLGAGYGETKEKLIRIANFPMHTREQFEKVISVLSEH